MSIPNNKRKYYKNIKTSHVYLFLGEVINATNKNDGQKMILYDDRKGTYYVRETKEFYEKFEKFE